MSNTLKLDKCSALMGANIQPSEQVAHYAGTVGLSLCTVNVKYIYIYIQPFMRPGCHLESNSNCVFCRRATGTTPCQCLAPLATFSVHVPSMGISLLSDAASHACGHQLVLTNDFCKLNKPTTAIYARSLHIATSYRITTNRILYLPAHPLSLIHI